MEVILDDVCERGTSNLKMSDVIDKNGEYPIYGAAGYIGNVDFYHQEKSYIAVVKDGAGIGRTMLLPEKSSIIGTMQYLIPKENILPEYLYYVVKNMHLEKYFTGATIPHIYFKDYKTERFNLLPIDEQRKIVGVLRKIEKIIELRKEELKNLDELIKSRFVEMFGDPKYNEMGWEIKKVNEIFEVGSSKRIYQHEQTSTGIPFLRISNLVQRIKSGTNSCELYISEEKYKELKEKSLVPLEGDILITSRGTLGMCYIVKSTDQFYFQDGMISWLKKCNVDVNSLYITYLFGMESFKRRFDESLSGTTVNYLSIDRLGKLEVIFPPIDLQTQFADFVHQVDKLKSSVQQSLEEVQLLFDSLMQQYFG